MRCFLFSYSGERDNMQRMGIAQKLIITFILLSVVPLSFISGFTYLQAENTVKNKVGFYSKKMVEQVVVNVDSKIEELENISMMILSNTSLMNSAQRKTYENTLQRIQEINAIESTLFSMMSSNNNIKGIYLYKANGESFGSGVDLTQSTGLKEEFFKLVKETGGKPLWVCGLGGSYDYLYLLRPLVSLNNLKEEGILAIFISIEEFNSIFQNADLGDGEIFLLDENRTILSHLDQEQLGVTLNDEYLDKVYTEKLSDNFNHGKYVVSYGTTKNGWKVTTKEPISSLMQEMEIVRRYIIIVALICIIIAILIGTFMALGISKPLKSIMNLMSKVEGGDLTVLSSIKGTNEIGKLSLSFNTMIEHIRSLIIETAQVVAKVEQDTNVISSNSSQSAAAGQVVHAITELAEGSTEQAKEAEKTNTLMEDLAHDINHVTKRIEALMDVIENTENSRDYAVSTIEQLNEKTKDAVESSHLITEEINDLNDETKEIIQVVKVITDISEKTNLLSLNAAIEAAKAGEAGKGFAVVADEIRKLALGTKEATNMISQIISSIQSKTQRAVSVVQSSDKIFEEQKNIVLQTNNAFNDMAESMQKIIKMIEDINKRIQDIEQRKDKSVDAISHIALIIEESAASIEEVTATTEEQTSSAEQLALLASNLTEVIDHLKKSLSRFKV